MSTTRTTSPSSTARLLDAESFISDLFTCNDPPSERQSTRILAHISHSEQCVKTLRQEIASIPYKIVAGTMTSESARNYFGLLQTHQNTILSYRKIFHISRCIPTEILEAIFEQLSTVVEWNPGERSQMWSVSQVCQRWRYQALRMPRLWTDFPRVLLHQRHSMDSANMFRTLLERSGKEMLKIGIFTTRKNLVKHGVDTEIVRLLEKSVGRVEVWDSEQPFPGVFKIGGGGTVRLTTRFAAEKPSERASNQTIHPSSRPSKFLITVTAPYPVPGEEGGRVVIPSFPYEACAIRNILQSLQASGRDQFLSCGCDEAQPQEESHIFPQLTKLVLLNTSQFFEVSPGELELGSLISYFKAPELRRLKICAPEDDSDVVWTDLVTVLNQSARVHELSDSIELRTEIREMSLCMPLMFLENHEEELGHLFSLTPLLTKLEIEDPFLVTLWSIALGSEKNGIGEFQSAIPYPLPHLEVLIVWISPDGMKQFIQTPGTEVNIFSRVLGPRLFNMLQFRFLGIRFKDFNPPNLNRARRFMLRHMNGVEDPFESERREWEESELDLLTWGVSVESEVERLAFRFGLIKTELNFLNPDSSSTTPSSGISAVLYKIWCWEPPASGQRLAIYASKLPLTLQELCSWEDITDPKVLELQGLASMILEKWRPWFEEDANAIEWVPYGRDGIAYVPRTAHGEYISDGLRSKFNPLDILYELDEKVVREYIDWEWDE